MTDTLETKLTEIITHDIDCESNNHGKCDCGAAERVARVVEAVREWGNEVIGEDVVMLFSTHGKYDEYDPPTKAVNFCKKQQRKRAGLQEKKEI